MGSDPTVSDGVLSDPDGVICPGAAGEAVPSVESLMMALKNESPGVIERLVEDGGILDRLVEDGGILDRLVEDEQHAPQHPPKADGALGEGDAHKDGAAAANPDEVQLARTARSNRATPHLIEMLADAGGRLEKAAEGGGSSPKTVERLKASCMRTSQKLTEACRSSEKLTEASRHGEVECLLRAVATGSTEAVGSAGGAAEGCTEDAGGPELAAAAPKHVVGSVSAPLARLGLPESWLQLATAELAEREACMQAKRAGGGSTQR